MKQLLRKGLCLALCGGMLLSASACGVIKNIKENARLEAMRAIQDTPDAAVCADLFNKALANSVTKVADDIPESVRFHVHNVEVTGGDSAELALLADAANQLRDLIMAENPGSSDRTLAPDDLDGTLLRELDGALPLETVPERNYADEKVTDEDGNDVTDENGNVITERVIADNLLELTLRYYRDTVIKEAAEDADGNREEAVTERTVADAAAIEDVFGEARDKDAVLAEFAVVKDYLQVKDYTFKYTDCSVQCELDLDGNLLNHVRFEKNMAVTAQVTGQGPLAEVGDFTVTFDVNEETAYEFHYPIAENDG